MMAALIFRLNMNIRKHISVDYFKSQSEQKTPTVKILTELTQTNLFFHKSFNKLENKIKTSLQINHGLLNVTVSQFRSSPFLACRSSSPALLCVKHFTWIRMQMHVMTIQIRP